MTEPLVHGWPRCAVCNQPVQSMTCTDDLQRNTVSFTAHCHGESETFHLTMYTARDASRIEFGLAFERPAMLATTHQGT